LFCSSLRSPPGRPVIAVSPHYLFEIIAWLGLAFIGNHLNVFLVAVGMASYLSGRAFKTQKWYEEKFPDWKKRANIVPGLF